MSRSSTPDRAQVEPTVALVAVFVVCAGLGLYATTLDAAIATAGGERERAGPTASRALDVLERNGIAVPSRLDAALAAGPDAVRVNLTLSTADERWGAGPPAPAWARDRASRPTAVRVAAGRVVPGRFRVVVWA